MTIAAGFRCTDGVLICADTEVSGGGTKFEGRKVTRRCLKGVCDYVIAGAGNFSYIGMASDLIEQTVYCNRNDLLCASNDDELKIIFHGAIEQAVTGTWSHMQSFQQPFELELIVGIDFNSSVELPLLLHVSRSGAVEWVDEAVIGIGDVVARSYLRILHRETVSLESMIPLALFVLYQTKQSGEACGGGSHVFKLPTPKSTGFWNDTTLAELTEDAMRLCLIESRNLSISIPDLRQKAFDLANRITVVRQTVEHQKLSRQMAGMIFEKVRKSKQAVPQHQQPTTADPSAPPPSPNSPEGSGES